MHQLLKAQYSYSILIFPRVFVVNYMIPGPVPMSFVVYLEGDKVRQKQITLSRVIVHKID